MASVGVIGVAGVEAIPSTYGKKKEFRNF